MKKISKFVLVVCLAIGLSIAFTGCGSSPSASKNVEDIVDFSTVPAITNEPTSIEGIWSGTTKIFSVTIPMEYTFSGNQFISAADNGNGTYTGTKGVFSLTDNAVIIYSFL